MSDAAKMTHRTYSVLTLCAVTIKFYHTQWQCTVPASKKHNFCWTGSFFCSYFWL